MVPLMYDENAARVPKNICKMNMEVTKTDAILILNTQG